jgi:hypothetical protein
MEMIFSRRMVSYFYLSDTGSLSVNELGKIINAPQSFKDKLPQVAFDGELWYVHSH